MSGRSAILASRTSSTSTSIRPHAHPRRPSSGISTKPTLWAETSSDRRPNVHRPAFRPRRERGRGAGHPAQELTMATFLAYIEPVTGRLYPLIPTLQELAGRGHRVTVRSGVNEVELLRSLGFDADLLPPELVGFEPSDWQARTRFGALIRALNQFGQRAPAQATDLRQAIDAEQPDVVILAETSWGAAAAAERSGLPWVFSVPSPVPVTSRDAPPFGLGLTPRHDAVGRVRDGLARPLTVGTLARIIGKHVNPVRTELGLSPLRTLDQFYLAASLVLVYSAEPFEYPRSDWPARVRLVGPGLWEPPADPPSWLADLHRSLVLVTCSTAFQNDVRLAEVACEAFAGGEHDVDASRLQV